MAAAEPPGSGSAAWHGSSLPPTRRSSTRRISSPASSPTRRRSSTRRPSSSASSRPGIRPAGLSAVRPAARPVRPAARQYGQQPGQYGQYPQYGSTETPEGSKRSLALVGGIIGLLAALVVAVVAVLGFWKPGFFVTTKLDVSAAQSGVKQILTDESNGYGAKNVKDVKCNNGESPTVKKGETFDCEVSIDGTKRQVTVTFQDNNGTYEVGRPK